MALVRTAVFVLLGALCLSPASAVNAHAAALVKIWESSEGDSPVERVIKLLEEMKQTLDSEADKDKEQYDKIKCWCDTNDMEKTKAISDAEEKISQLEADSQRMAARNAQLTVQIEALKTELIKDKGSLKTATELREKENAEFMAEEKSTVQAITNLKNAIRILSKHNAGLIQMTPALQESVSSVLRWVATKHDELKVMDIMKDSDVLDTSAAKTRDLSLLSVGLRGKPATDADHEFLSALQSNAPIQSTIPIDFASRVLAKAAGNEASFAQQPMTKSYEPQSGAIFGILKQMAEEFESNLSTSQSDEATAASAFASMKAAAEDKIDAGTKKLDEMETEFGTNTKALSDAKEDLGLTRDQFKEDKEFLGNLRLQCKDLEKQYLQRVASRNEEIAAVGDTIGILTSDDARDNFGKTMGHGQAAAFVQLKAVSKAVLIAQARNNAVKGLLKAAAAARKIDGDSWNVGEEIPHEQLAQVAMSVQLDAFGKVKELMEGMIEKLKVEQEEEVKLKTGCKKDLFQNEKDMYTTQEQLDDVNDKIQALSEKIETLQAEVKDLQEQIATMNTEIKKAGEARKGENLAFQEAVTDQRAMQQILGKALDRMAEVYKSAGRGNFVQVHQHKQTPPGGGFAPTSQNAGASPVLGLLEQVIEDSKKLEAEAMAGENAAQKEYLEYVANSHAAITEMQESIAVKSGAIATMEAEKTESEMLKQTTETTKADLEQTLADLHTKCDFTLANFDIRQKGRLQEIEGIKKAITMLEGAK
eukprot:gnl/TRDRNA2_/TRDRNA2_135085_c1_seq13.p1 gnl/TRDRNA2_/TRDRNA2_135085_c1~~gnl/TRDRNA2_/TRDRNA2_135085_c1_seq13.p1  ORF type:complete len:761 (-),score=273.78 gnl/TRDRNA2_/TRDRNA2_135085_c1_seq13:201-2483(-)